MQKKSNTILTAVLTALFVLSVGYFALLAPTTAWYYQKEDDTYSFEFGDFDMTNALQSGEQQIADITFRGATRFADAGETLFDEMLHIIKIDATNDGDSNGSVRVTVKRENDEHELVEMPLDNADGLRWFVYEPEANKTVKDKIDAMLKAWNPDWPIDYNTLTSEIDGSGNDAFSDYNQENGEAETEYEKYNAGDASGGIYSGAINALIEYNKRGVTVPANSTKEVYVAFWVEYGAAKSALGVGDSAAQRDTSIPSLTFEDLTISIKAMPDIGGTDTTALTISNTASVAADVKLYYWTDGWTLYTDDTYTDGVITVASGSSVQLEDLSVGERYKLEIQGASPTVHFNDSDPGREMNDAGTVITGTFSNGANAISIAANA